MADHALDPTLYNLLSWMSPSWPIGAFSYSSGLEWAVEAGLATDRAGTAGWVADMLDNGAIWTDAVMFIHSHRAVMAGNAARLASVADLANAVLTSRERHMESTAQGAAFRRIAQSVADGPTLRMLDGIDDEELSYPVTAACLMAEHGIPALPALTAFLHGVVANLVSAAQRLIPLGQTDGQLVLHALRENVLACARRAMALDEGDPFDHMGSAALMTDLASMAHETQYTRLFRT